MPAPPTSVVASSDQHSLDKLIFMKYPQSVFVLLPIPLALPTSLCGHCSYSTLQERDQAYSQHTLTICRGERRFALHNPTHPAMVLSEDWQLDPIESRMKPTAPDHIRDLERASIREERELIAHPDDSGNALDAGSRQVASLYANSGNTPGQRGPPHSASSRLHRPA